MSYDKSLDKILEEIIKNPEEILSPKYDYMRLMFPEEYIKGLKIYINSLNSELNNLKTIVRIKSKL